MATSCCKDKTQSGRRNGRLARIQHSTSRTTRSEALPAARALTARTRCQSSPLRSAATAAVVKWGRLLLSPSPVWPTALTGSCIFALAQLYLLAARSVPCPVFRSPPVGRVSGPPLDSTKESDVVAHPVPAPQNPDQSASVQERLALL